jgi:hypothetical protein
MSFKSRCRVLPASILSILLFSALLSFAEAVSAQEKLTTTTVADDKFGKGGTLETTSDENFRVVKEVWKDKDGKVKETHSAVYNGNQLAAEIWIFGGDNNLRITTFKHAAGDWSFYGIGESVSGIAKEEIQKKVENNEAEFIKTGTITRPKKPTANNVPAPEDKPKKEDPPKTDKTSTGESGGNNASTAPFTAPGYALEVKKEFDLVRLFITTPEGAITENIPADIQPRESLSGSSWFDPKGKDEAERQKNLNALKKYEFKIGKVQVKPQDTSHSSQLEDWELDLPLDTAAMDRSAEVLLRDSLELKVEYRHDFMDDLSEAINSVDFEVPTGGQQGSFLTIHGPFDGKASKTDSTKIGGQPAPTIAESPHSRVVWNTSKSLIPTIEVTENGKTGTCPFHNVSVTMSHNAPIRLLRGQTATVTVTFTGLGKLNQDVPYDLMNHSPDVISMQGAEEAQTHMIPYTMIANPDNAQGGTYTDHVTITGVAPGPFRITATVRWKETCDLPPNAMHKQ